MKELNLSDTLEEIAIGDVRPEGTVLGFCKVGLSNEIIAAVYDDSREGHDDALTIVKCVEHVHGL